MDEDEISINNIKEWTGMTSKDILYILTELKIYYQGTLNCDPEFLSQLLKQNRDFRKVILPKIRWVPYAQRIDSQL